MKARFERGAVLIDDADKRAVISIRGATNPSAQKLAQWGEDGAFTGYAWSVTVNRQNAMTVLGVGAIFGMDFEPGLEDMLRGRAVADVRTARAEASMYGRTCILEFPAEDRDVHDAIYDTIAGRMRASQSETNFEAVSFPLEGEVAGDACESALKVIQDFGFACDAELLAEITKKAEEFAAALDNLEEEILDIQIPGMTGKLAPYQATTVAYVADKQRVIIADPPGSGKTLQALASIQYVDAWPAIAMVPSGVREVWRSELKKFFPNRRAFVLNGRQDDWIGAVNADLLIVSYDLLSNRHVRKAIDTVRKLSPTGEFRAAITDESHHVKDDGTQRWARVNNIMYGVPVRILLTGTPLLNRPDELIGQLELLDKLYAMGGRAYFDTRYNEPTTREMKKLNLKLRNTCMLRRTKQTIAAQLKDSGVQYAGTRPREVQQIPLSEEAWADYQKAEADFAAWVREKVAEQPDVQAAIAGLSPSDAADVISDFVNRRLSNTAQGRAAKLVKIAILRQAMALAKLPAIAEMVDDWFVQSEPEDKLVVFAHHQKVIEQLVITTPQSVAIYGAIPANKREAIREKFQTDHETRAMVMGITVSEGISLTAANHSIFIELDWSPKRMEQAEARTDRIGQTRITSHVYVLGTQPDGHYPERTIDDMMWDQCEKKRSLIDATADGDDPELQSNIMDEVVRSLVRKTLFNLGD